MKQEESLRREIHAALEPVVRPAPQLTDSVISHLRAEPITRRRPVTTVLRSAAVLGAAGVLAVLVLRLHLATQPVEGPPVPGVSLAPIAAGPGANVAWLQGQNEFVGVDPRGHIVRTIQAPSIIRSTNESELYAVWSRYVDVYSAADGTFERRIARQGTGLEGDVSADGRYLALLDVKPGAGQVELIDLVASRSLGVLSLGSTLPNTGPIFIRVSPGATRIYAFTSFWMDTAIDVVGFDGSTLRLLSHAINGQAGHTLPSCDGLSPESVAAAPLRLLPDGMTMVSFCPGDGVLSWFDVTSLNVTKRLTVEHRNPFWISPAFSRDGSFLYLQEPGTGKIHVLDLVRRRMTGSVILTAPSAFDPFGWLATPADAGGIPRTVVLSGDGRRLYATSGFGYPGGLWTVELPDLKVLSQQNVPDSGGSLWLSGDGQTIYVLNNGGSEMTLMHPDGTRVATVALAPTGYDFLQ